MTDPTTTKETRLLQDNSSLNHVNLLGTASDLKSNDSVGQSNHYDGFKNDSTENGVETDARVNGCLTNAEDNVHEETCNVRDNSYNDLDNEIESFVVDSCIDQYDVDTELEKELNLEIGESTEQEACSSKVDSKIESIETTEPTACDDSKKTIDDVSTREVHCDSAIDAPSEVSGDALSNEILGEAPYDISNSAPCDAPCDAPENSDEDDKQASLETSQDDTSNSTDKPNVSPNDHAPIEHEKDNDPKEDEPVITEQRDTKRDSQDLTKTPLDKEAQRKQDFQKKTLYDIKAATLIAGTSIISPPLIVPSAMIAGYSIYTDLKVRSTLDPDTPVSKHFYNFLTETANGIFGDYSKPSNSSEKSSSPVFISPFDLYKIPLPSSALTNACFVGNTQLVTSILENKSASELKALFEDEQDQYALHYAALGEKAEICKILIQNGAPANIELCGKTPEKLTNNQVVVSAINGFLLLRNELDVLVGLTKIKRNIYQLANKLILDKRRSQSAMGSNIENARHMIISGNPGTGKTKVAALIAKLYYSLGVIKKNVFLTVQRGDLCASYIGQTAPKTRKCIERAAGGILFVDEAYRLSQADDLGKDFGPEAIEEIMQHMTITGPNRTTFIFAGYKIPMQKFINTNQGILRRVDFQLHLDDYTCAELAEIAERNIREAHYHLGSDVTVKDLEHLIEKHTDQAFRSKMNGGLSEKMVQYTIQIQNDELSLDADGEELYALHYNQFEKAILLLLHGGDIHELETSLSKSQENNTKPVNNSNMANPNSDAIVDSPTDSPQNSLNESNSNSNLNEDLIDGLIADLD